MEWPCEKGRCQMSLLEECIEYFKQPGFQRMIELWIDKYASLGHLGGKIKLENLSILEQETLGLFLGNDLSCGYLYITYSQFNKQFQKTKFEGIDFLEVLNNIKSSPILTHQELKDRKLQIEIDFKNQLLSQYQDTRSYSWLSDYFDNDRLVNKFIHNQEIDFYQILDHVCQAINDLPVFHHQYVLLPVFSQQITKDPHYFDNDLTKELLLKGIEFILNLEIKERTVENINEVFYQGGLLRDDLSNNCYICHIRPITKISGWYGFYEDHEPWNMNLYNLMKVDSLFEKQSIYIVENPSVFRCLVTFIQEYHFNVGLICSNGQINLCTYMLFDKLIESGCRLYYAGDYDPEGLLIADKLKQKYLDSLCLWCYDIKYFDKISKMQENISPKRIQILKHIQDRKLQMISSYIIEHSCFGYQEGLIEEYKRNMRK